MSGPLHGVRIIDLSTVLSGPVATSVLADQGAEVIKIEGPGRLDLVRTVGSHRGGITAMFELANRGKRSLLVDLARPEGLELLRRLVVGADVVVENFRPGVAERLGFGYEELRRVNPALIYTAISGFGRTGPLARSRVYDNMIQAASGMAAVQGDEDAPAYVRNLVCDKITALTVAQAVTAALLARDRGHGGQRIDVAMLDAAISFLWTDAGSAQALLADDATVVATGRSYGLTRHRDGWTTSAPVSDEEFRGWCRAMDAPEVADDPRFATRSDRLRSPEFHALRRQVEAKAATMTVAEAIARLAAEGVDAVEAVRLEDLADHPQVLANGTFVERHHPRAGPVREVAPPAHFSATPASPGAPAPAPGADSAAILAELGYDGEQIAALVAAGIVG